MCYTKATRERLVFAYFIEEKGYIMEKQELAQIRQQLLDAGFDRAAQVSGDMIDMSPAQEVRGMCKLNYCGKFGKTWSCPPGCGEIDACTARILSYDQGGILVQKVYPMVDSYDFEGAQEGQKDFNTRFEAQTQILRGKYADMLPLGMLQLGRKTNFTVDEQFTLMTLWSIARSPLMHGGDMTKTDSLTLALLTNDEVLAVNQHSANNRQLYRTEEGSIAWVADVPGSKDKYLALFNARDKESMDPKIAAFNSELITRQTPGHGVEIEVDITNQKKLFLVVEVGNDDFMADHLDWCEPRLVGPKGELKLTDLKWKSATSGWRRPTTSSAIGGAPMSVDGRTIAYGIGTHAPSIIEYDLPEGYTSFKTFGGLDKGGIDQGRGATVKMMVFNTSPYVVNEPTKISVSLQELGFNGSVTVRDLWEHKTVGTFSKEFGTVVPFHGARLYRISATK